MVGLLGSKAKDTASPASITSRLLPTMLDEQRLAKLGTLNILDFGRANRRSLEFFNQYPCRLTVLDAAEALVEWSRAMETRMEEPPSLQQMQLELSGLLGALPPVRFDLVFLWDTLNHLHEHALSAFAGLLRRRVTQDFRGHGFMLHKRGAEPQLRNLGIAGQDEIAVYGQKSATLYAHNRKIINDTLGSDLKIDHGVLHGDGRLEFLLVSQSRPSRAV